MQFRRWITQYQSSTWAFIKKQKKGFYAKQTTRICIYVDTSGRSGHGGTFRRTTGSANAGHGTRRAKD
jgi:hypothetical protein